jgi:wobble nucleotide-excising tRNase
MIKKILKIKGVGKFTDFVQKNTSSWDGELKKITLIYGENGSGKTTLTSILRSLKNNDSLILKRKSFAGKEPEVKILIDGLINGQTNQYGYSQNKWDKHYPDIDIFDIYFVNENIYTGLEVHPEHKKNLFSVVIGETGVKLKEDIFKIKGDIENKNKDLKKIEEKIEKLIDYPENVEKYCKIEPDREIDKKIRDKESKRAAVKANDEIKDKELLEEINPIVLPLDFVKLTQVVSKSIDSISQEFLKKVEEHKSDLHMNSEAENWLKLGFENIKGDKCPFCLRPFGEPLEIIEAYSQYFNDEYIELQKNINILKNEIEKFNIDLCISKIENSAKVNEGRADFWKTYTRAEFKNIELLERKDEFIQKYKDILELIQSKSNSPIQSLDTKKIVEFEDLLKTLNHGIENYSKELKSYNRKIQKVKETPLEDKEELDKELRILKATKQRGSKDIDDLCKEYDSTKSLLGKLNNEKSKKQHELDIYTKEIFAKYSDTINRFLKKFAPYLEIKKLKGAYKGSGKEPFVEYLLYIAGNEVKFADDNSNPCMKYSLSEGDKSALAFSFFLAKLNLDENINNKIIVFDDPVSSFDLNRRAATNWQLKGLSEKAKQLIVLTHNIYFARDFWDNINTKRCQNLKIETFGNSSTILEHDLEFETSSGLLKDYEVLISYKNQAAPTDDEKRKVIRCIRPVLEGFLRMKFPNEFLKKEWLGDYIKKIRSAGPTDNLSILRDCLSNLEEINNFSKKFHHSFNNNINEPIIDAELRSVVEGTLKLIQKI